MAQQVNIAKAAHLLGISRHELQRLVHDGDLKTFEGQVDLEALCERYPALAISEVTIVERVAAIRGGAFARRVRETVMPDQGELESRLQRRTAEWATERALADKYRAVLEELARRLARLPQEIAEPSARGPLLELNRWLVEQLKE